MKFSDHLEALGRATEDMLWPPRCVACKEATTEDLRAGASFCEACWEELPWIESHYCLRCGVPLSEQQLSSKICQTCERRRWQFVWARSLLRHEGIAQQLVQRWKLEGEEYLGRSLSKLFAELDEPRLELLRAQDPLVVSIPMDPLRRLWRGYDPARVMASAVAKMLKLEQVSLLKRGEYRPRQLHRSGGARRRDWAGVFVMPEAKKTLLRQRPVVLVDDVMTTGSTLNAAAKVLRKEGCPLVVALSLTREV